MIHYFAYGSNLHPLRLIERVPSAQLVAAAECRQHRLRFNKTSVDGSSKCNMLGTDSEADLVYGAIYRLHAAHKADLDAFEGRGAGYEDARILVSSNEKQYRCFTYLAQPTHITENLKPYRWYKQLVCLGAKYLHFPAAYIASIESVTAIEDPDPGRRRKNDALIARMLNYR